MSKANKKDNLKKKIELLSYLILLIFAIVIICILFDLFIMSYFTNEKGFLKKYEMVQVDSPGNSIINPVNHQFLTSFMKFESQKTPRTLFIKFLSESVLIWAGSDSNYPEAFHCIYPGKLNFNNPGLMQKLIDRGRMLFPILMNLSFTYEQIPLSVQGNSLNVNQSSIMLSN